MRSSAFSIAVTGAWLVVSILTVERFWTSLLSCWKRST